ncbi:hypothetical protein FSARC_6111 [Fusarium sarcochroum]|uniref:Uncharacterized protein n=1 Tax=Fusarium sarcochroum TaxID=1208366 RepID=A0A8H4X9S1_9HYPO|nr:hypothetical protein FSARC_6111 [Fusarium sarcochroum]
MVRFTPLATLALVPLIQARLNWFDARDTIAECPPCSAYDKTCSHTVTVIEPSGPHETVTISDPEGSYHTVTVKEPGEPGKTVTITQNYQSPQTKVVYISQGEKINPPKETVTVTSPGKTVTVTETETSEHVVTKKVNVYPDPGNSNGNGYQSGPKTVTISGGHPAPSAGSPDYDGGVVTKVVGAGGDNEKYPGKVHTVTVVNGGEVKTLTYTDSYDKTIVKTITQDNGQEKVVTVTDTNKQEVIETVTLDEGGKKIIKTITTEDTNSNVVTKTIQKGGKYYTVIVKPEPTVSTITEGNGDYITTVVDAPHTYTLTAPAQYDTAAVTDDDCETFTRTATYTGKPEVEVIVYDPETGDSTCKRKEDGQPCHPGYDNDKTGYGDDDTHTGGDGSKGSGDSGDPSSDGDKAHEGGDSKGQYADPSHTKGQDGNGSLPVYTKIRTYGNGDTYTEVYGADETACDSLAVSTSIATVYNTVVVTVGGSSSQYASPSSTPTANRRAAKKARSPFPIQW